MKRIIFVLLLLPQLLSAQDLIVKKNGDTLKVVIKSINTNTIKYHYPFDKMSETVECGAKISKDLRCHEMTNNENGKCDLHHSVDLFSIGVSYVEEIMKDSIWVNMEQEDVKESYLITRQGTLSDTEYFNQQIQKTSDRMERASGQGLAAIGLGILGAGIAVAGGLTGSGEAVAIGGGIYLTALVFNISAWTNHGNAAKELRKVQLKD